MEAYCVTAQGLWSAVETGERVVENLGQVQVPTSDRVSGDA